MKDSQGLGSQAGKYEYIGGNSSVRLTLDETDLGLQSSQNERWVGHFELSRPGQATTASRRLARL